ncbi:hypothetical protein BJP36_37780 [Moorena producens JHB]|uniref:Uncharacterized protein n=1 Tax=Moorena producens (strain JHB) TaxID=1454205 RepID=A0A9Q9SUF3_MOOP1|nr:hypothetical protein [Moorena producens]WAN69847.1 hypothetical protein BJP36_37780 [Moorena producens JHB]
MERYAKKIILSSINCDNFYSRLPRCAYSRRIKFATGRTAPDSRLPIPCSLFPVPCSLFP